MINPWNILEVVQLSDPSAPSDWAAASAGSSLEQAVCLCVFSISAGKLHHQHSPSSLYSFTSCASCTVALPVQSWHKNDQTCLLYMANQEEIEKCFHYVIEWYRYYNLIAVPSIWRFPNVSNLSIYDLGLLYIFTQVTIVALSRSLSRTPRQPTLLCENEQCPTASYPSGWLTGSLTLIVKFQIRKVRSSR